MKLKRLLAAILSLVMLLGSMGTVAFATETQADVWDGTVDISWYNPADPKTEYTITTAEQLAGFAELVDGGNTFADKTVKLAADLDLYFEDSNEPKSFDPIGDDSPFKGTFDGDGHTILNLYQSGWAFGYEWGRYGSIGLFGELEDAIVKNVTISGAESFVEGGDVGGICGSAKGTCVFEKITISDSVFATYNNGNGGIIGWSGAGNYTFKDITIAEDVTLAGLWGSFDSSIGGVVGQAEPGATYNFNNVDIACRLDIYNDCTASYDYYNYRMCGMIIGRLEETTNINGKNYPNMSKYTINCNDVNVTIGKWANYHYCEPTPGYNNGRGMRVEAGYSYDGLPADYDHSGCTQNHMACIYFDTLFGGTQLGVEGADEDALVILNYEYRDEISVDDKAKEARSSAKIGDNYYETLEEAVANVKDGETITLLKDIELGNTVALDNGKSFTIDGEGKKITNAGTTTNAAIMVGNSNCNDPVDTTPVYTIKNIVFDGWTTDHIIRCQGVNAVVEGCVFTGFTGKANYAGAVTSTFSNVTVKNCEFSNNDCYQVIDVNSNVDTDLYTTNTVNVIDDCTFTNNKVTAPGVVLVSAGKSTSVLNSKFIENSISTNGNAATVYFGFNTGIKAVGNLFKKNNVETTLSRTTRVGGALFAGFADENCKISGNAFIGNSATANGQPAASSVAYSAYYGAGNISGNYWNKTTDPVEGVDYTHEYPTTNALALDDYYTTINFDANKDFTLSNIKYIVKDVELNFEDVTADDAEGEKVYDIKIKAEGQIINRLNSVDLSFVHSKIEGDTEFEIIAFNPEVVINPVDNSKERYEFHYNGKTDVKTDTAETITIGRVKFTGYGKFSFAVDASVDTNAAHATKNDNNIVDTFVPGGVLADGTKVGEFDVTKNSISGNIAVPVRDLAINIKFPNAVENQSKAYQEMKVVISGGDLKENIEIKLGSDWTATGLEIAGKVNADCTVTYANNAYAINVIKALTLNNAYTVTVSGAGYRTARYTVTMTKDKTLNFWNNVMDDPTVVEEGELSETKNFLAGDIVKDNNINIYDLSAVVSYFGTENAVATASDYAKYDLNRDGVIDSRDVAYVLVSWGE